MTKVLIVLYEKDLNQEYCVYFGGEEEADRENEDHDLGREILRFWAYEKSINPFLLTLSKGKS